MTLFEIGDDLSNEFCVRTMKTSRFDVYTLNENQNIKIKHCTRRGPSEQIGECTYIAGIAYDSFNVWIHKGKQPDGSFLESCVAEDVKSFDEAFSIAQSHK